jgi:hypothetical protein
MFVQDQRGSCEFYKYFIGVLSRHARVLHVVDNIRHVCFPRFRDAVPRLSFLSLSLSLSPSFGDSILFNLSAWLAISRDDPSRDENIQRSRGGSISTSRGDYRLQVGRVASKGELNYLAGHYRRSAGVSAFVHRSPACNLF